MKDITINKDSILKLKKMREEGYYFVKSTVKWQIAYYYKYGWEICGNNNLFVDADFKEIGDKIELPKD